MNFFQNLIYNAKLTTSVGWIPKHHQDLFATHAFPAQGLSAMLVSPGKGSCHHHRFAHALARYHCKEWVPGRVIALGGRSFRLKIIQQSPIFCYDLWKIMGFYSWNTYDLSISNVYLKWIIKLRENSFFNWFTPIYVLIRPDVIWKKLSRPLYHVHFTVIHTNSRHTKWHKAVYFISEYTAVVYITKLTPLRTNGSHNCVENSKIHPIFHTSGEAMGHLF